MVLINEFGADKLAVNKDTDEILVAFQLHRFSVTQISHLWRHKLNARSFCILTSKIQRNINF